MIRCFWLAGERELSTEYWDELSDESPLWQEQDLYNYQAANDPESQNLDTDFKSVAGICWSVWISNAVI